MANLIAKLINGETFEIVNVDLNHHTPLQLIEELINKWGLQHPDNLPCSQGGRHQTYYIVNKYSQKIRPLPGCTFQDCQVDDGDTLRIILLEICNHATGGFRGAYYDHRIYETMLRHEFKLLQKLERCPAVRDIIKVSYKERFNSTDYKSIQEDPMCELYPTLFKVKYTFPIMYVGKDEIEQNWSYAFTFDVSTKDINPDFEIDGGFFPDDYMPFNSHICRSWVNIGNKWGFSHDLGIWVFIISVGELLNQDKNAINIHESVYLNQSAFEYWLNDRMMQPNNIINWPRDIDRIDRNYFHFDICPPKGKTQKIFIRPKSKVQIGNTFTYSSFRIKRIDNNHFNVKMESF